MNLCIKVLKSDCTDFKILESINKEAFPPSEYMPAEEIFAFVENTDSDVLGIYDGHHLVGFFLFLKNRECGYIFFFAIDKSMRSKGYGSESLKMLSSMYPALQIILDFEEINENAENIDQRIRRKAFYLRNGFCETGRYTFLRDERFEVVCNRGTLRVEAFKELISVIHSRCPFFPNKLL